MRTSFRSFSFVVCAVLLACAVFLHWEAGPAQSQGADSKPPAGTASPAKSKSPGSDTTRAEKTDAAPAVAGLTVDELEAFVKTIEDKAAREAFVKQLKTLIALQKAATEKKQDDGFLAAMSRQAEKLSTNLVDATKFLADVPGLWAWMTTQYQDEEKRQRWIEGFWKTLLVILAGILAELLTRTLLARPRRRIEARQSDAMTMRIFYLGVRTVLDLIPMGAFAAVAYGVLPLLEPTVNTSLVALTLIYANLLARAIRAVARAVLAPRAPSLRLFTLSDVTAAYLFVWIRRVTNFTVYTYFVLEAAVFFGLPLPAHAVLIRLVGFGVAVMVGVFILQNRSSLADWLRGGNGEEGKTVHFPRIRGRIADMWHVLALLYVAAAFIIWAVDIEGGFAFMLRGTVLTLVVFVLWALATGGAERVVARVFRGRGRSEAPIPAPRRAGQPLPSRRTSHAAQPDRVDCRDSRSADLEHRCPGLAVRRDRQSLAR